MVLDLTNRVQKMRDVSFRKVLVKCHANTDKSTFILIAQIRSQQSYPSAMILKTTGGTRIIVVGRCSFKDNVMTVMSMLADSKIGLTNGKLSTQSSLVVVIPFC